MLYMHFIGIVNQILKMKGLKKGFHLFLSFGKNVDTATVLHVCLASTLQPRVCLERIEKAGCATQYVDTF